MNNSDESTIIVPNNSNQKPGQEVKNNEKANGKTNDKAWRQVLIGGIPGILLGSAGTAFASGSHDQNAEEIINLREEVEALKEEVALLKEEAAPTEESAGSGFNGEVSVAHGVNDGMSFSEAFAAARAEVGPGGVFSWHGDVYSTYYEEEWNAMSEEGHNDFANAVQEANYVSDVPSAQDYGNSYQEVSNQDDGEIHVLGQETVQGEDGQVINVFRVETDGHYGELYDIDGDGRPDAGGFDMNDDGNPDIAVVDENQDGMIDETEVYYVPDSQDDAQEFDVYDDMPDYTNDADATSFI